MTAPEIADVLGIPLNTVYSRLRVARGELRRVGRIHRFEAHVVLDGVEGRLAELGDDDPLAGCP